MQGINEDPCVIVTTHNFFSTHESLTKEENAAIGNDWIEGLQNH